MIGSEQNERMTLAGPGTPPGRLLRRHWQPVRAVEELAGPRPAHPV